MKTWSLVSQRAKGKAGQKKKILEKYQNLKKVRDNEIKCNIGARIKLWTGGNLLQ